jgi:hypothetical protein
MERIYSPDEEPLNIRVYYASSLAMMLHSRDQVIEDTIRDIDSGDPIESTSNRLIAKLMWLSCFLEGKDYFPPSRALVFIPAVRHFPDRDPSKLINISDGTAECLVKLPSGSMLRAIRKSGLNLDPITARNTSWCSDVILANIYTPFEDQLNLVHIENRLVRDEEREGSFDFLRQLASQGLGGRV